MLYIVIMAGGAGTRFWPESRIARPKQLLPLAGERTMLEMTMDRLGTVAEQKNVWILTAAAIMDAVRAQVPKLPADHIIGEPCKRDTAPCIGLAALLISRSDPEGVMAVMPADQVIQPDDKFQQCVKAAAALVEQKHDRIVTFGIKPTFPATTYGYIERNQPLADAQKLPEVRGLPVYTVARFKEKPKADLAKEYFDLGTFYWNSGIFIWKAKTIIAALAQRQPEMLARLQKIVDAWGKPDGDAAFAREFAGIKGISIDYAVMEQAPEVAVIEVPFSWDDVGTWHAAARQTGADAQGNSITGKQLTVDTKGSIIRSDDNHLVATVGVSDLIVVHTPDATLVANRNDEEAIRKIVKLLEEKGWKEYL
jgi:mannose-1-phosphate guanylyltransferase